MAHNKSDVAPWLVHEFVVDTARTARAFHKNVVQKFKLKGPK
jgi:hypothetical protein